MVHPTELLRTNSNETRTFSAPRAQYSEYQLDCGLTSLPLLNRWFNLERFAKPKVFLVFLSLIGFLQGVTLTYFRETARIWGKHYNISNENVDWLIYTNEFLIGLIALVVSYYGNKIHRISWIGGLTIFHSIASGILLVPEIYRKNYKEPNLTAPYLCVPNPPIVSTDTEINYIALVVLVTFQIFFAMVAVSFISHGITYIDDNTSAKSSPGYIGITLASKELGKQAGLYFSWIPIYKNLDNLLNTVFVSPVWLCIASATFISGVLIAMFPKNMPSTLVQTLSASIVDLASGHRAPPRKQKIDGFFTTICRLLRNKILMVNIFSAVLIEAGLVNFNIFEKFFNQSRFQISQLYDTSYTMFTTNILKQPLVAISLIAAGFLAAKTKPHLKSLVKWNIAAIILVIIFFGSTAFLRCDPKTKNSRMLMNQCRMKHRCSEAEFHPVCMKSQTFFSACYAGCSGFEEDSRKRYYNCSASGLHEAFEGPCDEEKCNLLYALSQINSVFTSALLATTLVTNLIINMRCILSRDKATALGLEATFIALISYLPVKAIYGAVAENYCIVRAKNGSCKLYSKHFATFLSACTISFMFGSLILAVAVLLLLKFRPIDDDDVDDVDEAVPRDSTRNERSGSITSSLLEMENVGDDHDSVDSSSNLDDLRPSRGRIIESNF